MEFHISKPEIIVLYSKKPNCSFNDLIQLLLPPSGYHFHHTWVAPTEYQVIFL